MKRLRENDLIRSVHVGEIPERTYTRTCVLLTTARVRETTVIERFALSGYVYLSGVTPRTLRFTSHRCTRVFAVGLARSLFCTVKTVPL